MTQVLIPKLLKTTSPLFLHSHLSTDRLVTLRIKSFGFTVSNNLIGMSLGFWLVGVKHFYPPKMTQICMPNFSPGLLHSRRLDMWPKPLKIFNHVYLSFLNTANRKQRLSFLWKTENLFYFIWLVWKEYLVMIWTLTSFGHKLQTVFTSSSWIVFVLGVKLFLFPLAFVRETKTTIFSR